MYPAPKEAYYRLMERAVSDVRFPLQPIQGLQAAGGWMQERVLRVGFAYLFAAILGARR